LQKYAYPVLNYRRNKMEIKRVIAGGLAALAAGATLALGAGAVTLGDFVTVTGNTMTSPYIVIGGNAAAEDTLAAADIGVALGGQATTTVVVPGAVGVLSVTDGAAVETKSTKLYVGQQLDNILSKFTVKELPTLLASGVVKQKDGKEVDYGQRIYTGSQVVQFNREISDWDDPALNVELVKNANLYTYLVKFSPAIDVEEIENKDITLLGKPYMFSDVAADLTGTKLTLFAASQTESVAAGESVTVTVLGTDYVITVVGINTEGTAATIDVNGEAFEIDESEGELDIEKGDLKAHVKAIRAFKFPAEAGSVELFIGSEEMVLEHGEEVLLGDEEVDGTSVAIDNTTTKIRSVSITYAMEDKEVLKAGESFTEPVFESFKVAFGGIFPDLDAASKDLIEVESSSDTDVDITFTNKDGIEYDETLLWYNDTSNEIELTDGDYAVHVCNNETVLEGEYIVVTDEEYTYILVFDDYTSDDEAVLKDVSTGTEYPITVDDVGDSIGVGSIDIEVTGFDGTAESVALNTTAAGISETSISLYTEQGASLVFGVNCSSGDFKDYIEVTESEFETTDAATEVTLNVSFTTDTSADNVEAIDVQDVGVFVLVSDEEGDYEYGVTEGGTYAVRDKSTDNEVVTIYTPDEPAPVTVAFGSDPSFAAGEGVTAGTVEQAVQIKNSVSKMESEITTSTLSRDLVLLGGPCANSLVAELLNMSASKPQCVADFTALYPTEGVITVVSDAFGSGQKALVIAGVDRTATRTLAVKVMQGTVEYSA